jgi:hypothetical protein
MVPYFIDIEVDMLRASIMSLTFSIARVEYVTLWLVVGAIPLGMSNGSSPDGTETISTAPPTSEPGVRGGDEDLGAPLIVTTGMLPVGTVFEEGSGVVGGVCGIEVPAVWS